MSATIVIPFRGPWGAKSRLAPALAEPMRASLALSLYRHVLAEAISAGAAPVLVVTPSGEAASLAKRYGASVLRETAGSLNAAVTLAAKSLNAAGIERMAVIAADLPLLESDDIAALLGAGCCDVTIAPDRAGSGTNAMAVPVAPTAAGRFGFHYGHKSLAAHRREAARLGLAELLIDRAGLAGDLDTADDLALLDHSFVRLKPELRRAITRARKDLHV